MMAKTGRDKSLYMNGMKTKQEQPRVHSRVDDILYDGNEKEYVCILLVFWHV